MDSTARYYRIENYCEQEPAGTSRKYGPVDGETWLRTVTYDGAVKVVIYEQEA